MTSSVPHVPRQPVVLIIMDGVGVNPSTKNNAFVEANTPRIDDYFSKQPHVTLAASGRAVGLPDDQMGNSEVGHLTLGTGTIIRQDLVRIDDAITDGSFFTNTALVNAARLARERGEPLHLIGLVSDGGVHSHLRHLLALIEICRREQVIPFLHMITDGRDTAPRCAQLYLSAVESALQEAGGRIVTLMGRYYAMDRDRRWQRTEKAFRAIALAEGIPAASAQEAIAAAYANDEGDEFIRPRIIGEPVLLHPQSVAILFNFRNDRPRQITAALTVPECTGFERGDFQPIAVTCLTQYETRFNAPIAFPPERPETTLAGTLSARGIQQFHCAETEKYAHVTFFFNGGHESRFPGEERVMVPSPKVDTYDLKPEMSAEEVANTVIAAIEEKRFGFVLVNFANGDMVGHTAVREPLLVAVETLDREVGRVLDAAAEQGYSAILTADHGNCDEYVDPVTGEPHTQHTIYPVPCMVMDRSRWRLATNGGLADVAPTVLALMGIEKPAEMLGESLLLEEVL